ncbi:MAG: MFS transporter [Caulobacteraceae bacterium]|nr:MFS transporter [Caulobacteraceae bacterium]
MPKFALVCAGTWLTAADELTTATIMPSVARDIGGYAWFGWAVAAFLLGSILGGATAGRLSVRFGLRPALTVGGGVYALGCAASALSPSIGWFLLGRLLQGLGGGWVVGLCYVAVSSLFPQSMWARVFSALAGVWGAATLVSPLIGGLFAEAGVWRGAFWLFAAQGLAFIVAGALLIRPGAGAAEPQGERPPYAQVLVLTLAVVAIGAAGLWPTGGEAAVSAIVGLALLGLFLRLDARASARLLPRSAGDPRTVAGAGLLMIFCLQAATIAFSVYGSALLQTLHHARPILAGYILGGSAFAWTAAALGVAGRGPDVLFIRLGTGVIGLALIGLALTIPHGPLPVIVVCVMAQGAGFGLAWSFSAARIVANTPEPERAFASSSMPTAQLIGAAVGAAAAGAIANLLGFGHGVTTARASLAGFWLFASFVPLAAVGWLAALRLTASGASGATLTGSA